jgi:hypothetical protein
LWRCGLLEGDGKGFQIGALVIELGCGRGDLFYDEGVSRDGGSGSVDSGVVTRGEFPYGRQGCGLNGVDDDLGDGLTFFRGH